MKDLLDFYWNHMETLESDDSRYAYVPYADMQRLEELMILAGGEFNSLATE